MKPNSRKRLKSKDSKKLKLLREKRRTESSAKRKKLIARRERPKLRLRSKDKRLNA